MISAEFCKLLLTDFGSFCLKTGMILHKYSNITQNEIALRSKMSQEETRNALSILIQRRFVQFTEFEGQPRYSLCYKNMIQRVFYAIYARKMKEEFSETHCREFERILLLGIVEADFEKKEIKDFLNKKLIAELVSSDRSNNKSVKYSKTLIYADLEELRKIILNEEIENYLEKKYNKTMKDVFKTLIDDCNDVREMHEITNCIGTKISCKIKNGDFYEDGFQAVEEYLNYLHYEGIINHNYRLKDFYRESNGIVDKIKQLEMRKSFASREDERLFFMVLNRNLIEDKEITVNSLLPLHLQKISLINLLQEGLLSQKGLQLYKNTQKVDSAFYVDKKYLERNILKSLENFLVEKMKRVEDFWEKGFFMGTNDKKAQIAINEEISIIRKYFLLI
ncbi:hypothetical protein NUSPORA_01819 [Nucleospora cyclopteri]